MINIIHELYFNKKLNRLRTIQILLKVLLFPMRIWQHFYFVYLIKNEYLSIPFNATPVPRATANSGSSAMWN